MIYFSGLESVIESIYLEDKLGNKVGECNIFVNPTNINYLAGKIIIINSANYSQNDIKELLDNGNTVISRVYEDIPGIKFQPYLIRISPRIIYNGKEINEKLDFTDILQEHCSYENGILYFPKLDPIDYTTLDINKNLTAIGWALYQVGVNIREDLGFPNLDIIKLKKLIYF